MFIEIAGAVTIGILAAIGVVLGILYIKDRIWHKEEPEVRNTSGLPYDINSPLVKRFQSLAGITESYGGPRVRRNRFNHEKIY